MSVMVTTQHGNNERTGANLAETILNTSNINVHDFGRLFRRPVEGSIYAQPLYLPAVNVPGKGLHNLVYVATMHNLIYAFDADDPAASSCLGTNFARHAHRAPRSGHRGWCRIQGHCGGRLGS